MAEKQIKHSDLIQDDIFQPTIEQTIALEAELKKLVAGFKALAEVTGKKIPMSDPKTVDELKQLENILAKINNTERAKTETEKQILIAQERLKVLRKQEIADLKAQDGILGKLVARQKELKQQQFTAKTKSELEAVNKELYKTTEEIKNVKEGGSKAFNSWSNALTSFQFKFNSLGSAIGNMAANFATGALSGGISLLTQSVMTLGQAFIDTIYPVEKVTEGTTQLKDAQNDLNNSIQETIDKERELRIMRMVASGQISEETAALVRINADASKISMQLLDEQTKRDEQSLKERIDGILTEQEYRKRLAESRKIYNDAILNNEKLAAANIAIFNEEEKAKKLLKEAEDAKKAADKKKKDDEEAKRKALQEAAEAKKIEMQKIQDKREALEQMRKYNIEAFKGEWGVEEQNTAKISIETKIRLGIVHPDELKAYNDAILKEKETAKKAEQDLWDEATKEAERRMEIDLAKEKKAKEERKKLREEEAKARIELAETVQEQIFKVANSGLGDSEKDLQRKKQLAALEAAVELSRAFLDVYQKYLKEPNTTGKQAFSKAASDIFRAKIFTQALAGGLYEGADSVGTEHAAMTLNRSKDNLLVPLHAGERVVGVEDSKRIAGMTNKELVAAGELYRLGAFNPVVVDDRSRKENVRDAMTSMLHKQLSELKQVVKDKESIRVDWNNHDERVERIVKGGITKVITHKKRWC